MIKHVKLIATHQELFGKTASREDIIKLIEKIPLLSSFILLSQISTDDFKEKKLKNLFNDMYVDKLDKTMKDYNGFPSTIVREVRNNLLERFATAIQKRVVFSPQSILQLWKWVLAYGDMNNMELFQEKPDSIYSVFYLSLLINDRLYLRNGELSDDLYAEVFSNAVFNCKEHTFNALCRTMLIYTEIAANKDLFHENEYLNINQDFINKYGYSIKDYIAVIFVLMAAFLKPKKLGEEWLHNIDEMFENTKLKDTAKEILSSLTTDFDSISKWAKDELDSTWNFIEFSKKPFLKIGENRFLPFSMKLVYEQLFMNLFHKVRHCYDKTDRSFLTFYGKPFEKYTQQIAEHATSQSRLSYTFINEFRYGKGNSKHSPDILIKLGDKLLAVEVKSYRLTLPSISQADSESIKRDTNKMVISPMKQLHNRIKELKQENHWSVEGIKDIYLMVVTQGHFPTLEFYETENRKEIENYLSIPVKGFYHLDIEEFENLCQVMERRRPVFKALDNKNLETNRYQSFKSFFYHSGYHIKHNKIFDETFEEYVDYIGEAFFEDFVSKRKEREKR